MDKFEDLKDMLKALDASLRLQAYAQNPDRPFTGQSVVGLALERIEELENMEIKLNEVDVQKLNLQSGEVLVVKVKSDQMHADAMQSLSKGLRGVFPNNKVVVLSVENDGSIDLTVAKESEYPSTNFCNDCSCGKKQAYEGT